VSNLTPEKEGQLARAVQYGTRAKAILADPIFVAAIGAVRKQYEDECFNATTPEEAFRGVTRVRSLDDTIKALQIVIDNGDFAAHVLEKEGVADKGE
jgi:hypothetical protein